MNGERGAPAGQAPQHATTIPTIKNNDEDKLPFLWGWNCANTFLPLPVSIGRRRWRAGEGEGEGETSRGKDRNPRNEKDGMWWTSPPNCKSSDSPLQTRMRPHRCVRGCYQHARSVECNAAEPGRDADLCRACRRGPYRTTREPRTLARSRDGDARRPSSPAPTTLPSTGLLPPASLSTCTRSSPSGTPFTTGARRISRRSARQGGTVRRCSGRSARWGGRGEGEDTDGMLDRAAFRRDLGC